MSQRSEKLRRQVEVMKERMDVMDSRVAALERSAAAWDAAEESVHDQAVLDAATQRNAERRRARQAERTAALWRWVAYIALVAAIIVEIIAILVIHANAACADDTKNTPIFATNAPEEMVQCEIQEDFENENIEAALLARSHVIDECTITYYCSERYAHICGTGDGIAADGTPVLAWATCAVDPDVIPLGSTVLVDLGDGYGLRTLVANDVGGSVKGNHIDLCVATHEEALQLGRQTATVYWCEEVN